MFDQTALESQCSEEDQKQGKTDQYDFYGKTDQYDFYDQQLGEDENAPPRSTRSLLTLPSFRKAFRRGHKSSRMLE